MEQSYQVNDKKGNSHLFEWSLWKAFFTSKFRLNPGSDILVRPVSSPPPLPKWSFFRESGRGKGDNKFLEKTFLEGSPTGVYLRDR